MTLSISLNGDRAVHSLPPGLHFIYYPASVPVILAISPSSGPVHGSTIVTVYASEWPASADSPACRFGDHPPVPLHHATAQATASPQIPFSSTMLLCSSPAHELAVGSRSETVRLTVAANGGGLSDQDSLSSAVFRYSTNEGRV